MAGLRQDVTYVFRRISKSPGFAAAAVVSIALGIGANSTVFSMVSRFILRPAPVGDPGALMALHTTQRGECCNQFTWPLFTDLQEQSKSFSGLAAYYELIPASIGGNGDPERLWGQATTTNLFDVAQIRMTLGRGFIHGEERLPVVILGYNLWRRRFGADPNFAGKTVTLSGRPFQVVGVAPPHFHGLDQILNTQFWVPLDEADQLLPNTSNFASRNYNWLAVIGRLGSGVTPEQAAAELSVIARRVAEAHPQAEKARGFRFEQAGSVPPRERSFVTMFLAALTLVALLVLCIACANVVNLLLAQASGRQREMAVRRALGATRGQLMCQMLTESVLLALGGGLLGAAFSLWATSALSALPIPAPVPLDLSIGVDWRTVLYTFLLSIATGLLLGLAPAGVVARSTLTNALKGEDSVGRPGSRWSLRNVLVVSQIAMSLVLLCATGLFLRSLQSAAGMDIGFRTRGVLTMAVDPRLNGYTAERTAQFLTELRQELAALPGVSSAACTDVVPLSGGNRSDSFSVEGRPSAAAGPSVDLYMATPGYFDTLGIPRIAGRDFGDDGPTAPKVAIVNEAFVQQLFHNENPIGQRVTGGGVTYQVIGVVKNIKSRTLGEELRPVLFRSISQTIGTDPSLMGYSVLVRAAGHSSALASAVRYEIRALDPTLAIFNAETLEEHFRSALFLPRLTGTLFGVFGAIGLLLAAVGLYGVMSYSISRRTREVGIRMALGSPVGAVQRLIIRQGMLLTLIAVVLGLAAAWSVAQLSAGVLYGVRPHDMVTFTVVPLFLAAVAFLACWIPARRAESVDPLTALRHE
ncbi:MAG TPA: ABC transporter permease [Verrucomicrobiae bacterium]|nr:ABC transporter permease [Verrucomicrobiae bacterium]